MESKGERRIRKVLEREGVAFEQEKSFPQCRSFKRAAPLRFDFLVQHPILGPTLIEFHGRHHFEYTPHFHKGKQDYDYRRHMDVLKCSFALAHKIPMFVIPFVDYERLNNFEDLFREEYRVRRRQHAMIHNPLKQ